MGVYSHCTPYCRGNVLVIGVGNDFRGDDGVGIEVARRLSEFVAQARDLRSSSFPPVGSHRSVAHGFHPAPSDSSPRPHRSQYARRAGAGSLHEAGQSRLHAASGCRGRPRFNLSVPRRHGGIEVRENTGDIATLIARWQEYDLVILVDAMQSGSPPGTITRFDLSSQPLPNVFASHVSSHGVGVGEAVALAGALGELPARLLVWGIEGGTFDTELGLSRPVAAAVASTVRDIVEEIGVLPHRAPIHQNRP